MLWTVAERFSSLHSVKQFTPTASRHSYVKLGGHKHVFATTCIHAWTTSSFTTMYVDAKRVERKQHLNFFTEAASKLFHLQTL